MPDRVLSREIVLCHGAANDRDARRLDGRVLRRKIAACQQGNPHGLEVSRRNVVEKRMGFRSRARCITRNGDIDSQYFAAQREQRGIRGGFNTRKMHSAIRQLFIKRWVCGFAGLQRDGHDVIGVEAKIVGLKVEQAVQEQTRSDENDRGDRDLRTEQQIAEARARRSMRGIRAGNFQNRR